MAENIIQTRKKVVPRLSRKIIDRFWGKVAITANPDKCWNWKASKDKSGYGRFSVTKTIQFYAHVISSSLKEENPDNLLVLHRCDNPNCCNPNHLFLGTHQDNANDCVKKKRQTTGERNGRSKLTNDQVIEIRKTFRLGYANPRIIAEKFGVSRPVIIGIAKKQLWKGVGDGR